MVQAAQPELTSGRAYRTQDLRRWSANPTRLAKRLVREGKLRRAAHGLFYAPAQSRFGPAPVPDQELLRAFLKGGPFVLTGPPRWNALGLGATAMFAATLVYNTERTGDFVLDQRPFRLRRVRFPRDPGPEWFVVDLLQNRDIAGVSSQELGQRLRASLSQGRWDRNALLDAAREYGTRTTQGLIEQCMEEV